INKSSAEYTEDNSKDKDNEDSNSAEEEQNNEDSDSVKTPPVKKRGRPKNIVKDNENKMSSVKRRGRPRKNNDESKKQTIGSQRKGREYKVEDDGDNDGTKRMKKKMDYKEAKVKRKRNQKNNKRKFVDDSSSEFEVTTTSSKCKKHKKNIKISNEKKKYIKIRTRTTPTALFNVVAILNVDRKKCLYEMGFGSLIGMAIHEFPGMLGFYVIDNLDTETNMLSLTDNSILVNSQSVHDILGIPMGGCSLESLESRSADEPFIKEWFLQFGDKNEVRPNDITGVIVSTNDAETTTGIDNDDTVGIDKESYLPDCQMESNSHASDDDNQKSNFQVLFHKESGNSDLQRMKNKDRNEDVDPILNEDDKVDDSCPAAGFYSVIEGDKVILSEVEDVEKEKKQIGNEDDRVVEDSHTTIPDFVTEGKGVKFIEKDNVLVDDVPKEKYSLNECDAVIQDENKAIVQDSVERSEHTLEKENKKFSNEELRYESLKGNVGAEDAVDSQETIEDIFKQDEQIQSAEG
nr:hypothetical protein [Tanacetum cinerariifolium]